MTDHGSMIPRLRVRSGGARAAALGAGAALLLAGCLSWLALAAPPRVPRSPEELARLLAAGPHADDCSTCHDLHGESMPTPSTRLLLGPDDNTFCERCHTVPWAGGSYAGLPVYAGSAHGAGPGTLWPGPDPLARTDPDAEGKCVNCHDPHGWSDPAGEIPALLVAREEALCFACHDGAPAGANIRLDMEKPFRHPAIDYTGRHSGPTEAAPADFGVSPVNRRHAECADCHNAHVGRHDRVAVAAPEASKTLLGASRVRVVNGAAGAAPSYFFTAGADTLTTPVTEYQLCFKCHSSWTTQPAGQSDLALVFNPANASYHPVEAAGKNPNIHVLSFVTGWTATSLVRCSDCHGSDNDLARGPHGSIYRYLLRRSYTASAVPRAMQSDELCFLCHSYDTYVGSQGGGSARSYSRFNPPASSRGHAFHVGTRDVSCYSCHETHGSVALPHLLARGRNPGLIGYVQSPTGGTCTPTCHGSRTYTVNYGR